jgi:hypothetical protein
MQLYNTNLINSISYRDKKISGCNFFAYLPMYHNSSYIVFSLNVGPPLELKNIGRKKVIFPNWGDKINILYTAASQPKFQAITKLKIEAG